MLLQFQLICLLICATFRLYALFLSCGLLTANSDLLNRWNCLTKFNTDSIFAIQFYIIKHLKKKALSSLNITVKYLF